MQQEIDELLAKAQEKSPVHSGQYRRCRRGDRPVLATDYAKLITGERSTGELPASKSSTSSHALSLADVIRLARTLQGAPQDIIVYAVEGYRFDPSAPMTDAVSAAASEVTRRVIAEVGILRRNAVEAASRA